MNRHMLLMLAGLTLLPAFTAQAEEPGFVRGYAQALLDEHNPELGLEVRTTAQEDTIELSGEDCISAAQQKSITRRITGNGPVIKVNWRLNCASEQAPDNTQAPTGLVWLPTTDIFRGLQADPREPQLAIKALRYGTRGKHFNVGAVQAGETFSLVEGHIGDGTWQLGIQGGIFSIFDQDKESNDQLNTDYIIALPLTFRKGNWSVRSRYFHMSSHLGDEYILNENIRKRLDLSFEAADTIISHDWKNVRLYGGGGYLVRTSTNLERGILQAGGEWRIKDVVNELDLSLGADYKSFAAQDWTVNQSYQAALIFSRNKREVRFLIEYYNGKSPNGQFFFNQLKYFGFGVQFGI